MNIEILYPEVANLYGELANITYLEKSSDDCNVIETALNEKPKFLDKENNIDLVYMGTMAESAQKIVLEKLIPLKAEIVAKIEDGMNFLITGNVLELFGNVINDATGEKIDCLGIFDFHTERNMKKRFNSLYVGKYGELPIVGFKSQFTHSYYDSEEVQPLFITEKGPGFNPEISNEGIRYKNFMATYLIGPLFVLNPMFMKNIAEELGLGTIEPAHFDAAMEAYNKRLSEYREENRGFYY